MRSLNIWMNGVLVGTWSYGRGDSHRFVYDADWLKSPACRSLSLSLPLSASAVSKKFLWRNHSTGRGFCDPALQMTENRKP